MFPCMLDTQLRLRVEGRGEGEDRGGGAVLHRDGRISQEVTVTISCTFYGSISCSRWGFQERATWRANCKDIKDVDVDLYGGSMKLFPAVLVFKNNSTNKNCCKDRDTFVNLYFHTISETNHVLSEIVNSSQCKYSQYVDESCNLESGQLSRSRFCVSSENILKEYMKVSCVSNNTMRNICNPLFNCSQ